MSARGRISVDEGADASANDGATIADRRDAAADRRDQLALVRDEAAAGRDDEGAAADARAGTRDVAAEDRDRGAVARDQDLEDRSGAAARDDRAAEERDVMSAARDADAARADATLVDLCGSAPVQPAVMEVLHRAQRARDAASADRRASAADRRAARDDRARAEALRLAGLEDRAAAAADRVAAHEDITLSSGRRGSSGEDRGGAGGDRGMAAQDRRDATDDRNAAAIDALTGVYLRGPGLVELEREIARHARTGDPLALVYLDVDSLKMVNDSSGHSAGDRLLRSVADAIRAVSRPYDLIIRVGGDEFVCALPGMTAGAATARMATVNTSLNQGPAHASVTVGVAALEPGDTADTLTHRADTALYLNRVDRSNTSTHAPASIKPRERCSGSACCSRSSSDAQSLERVGGDLDDAGNPTSARTRPDGG